MRVLIITTMRNEAPFLLEWIAYHQHIGVTDFLIFTNDCDDGTDEMLDRLAALGHVTHERNHAGGKKSVQWRALTKAKRHPLYKSSDWIFVCDVDEFLNIHAGDGHLSDLLDAVPDAEGFAIPWRSFGNAGVRAFEDQPILMQFTQAAPETLIWPWQAVQYKSLFRNHPRYDKLGVHRPKLVDDNDSGHWVDGNGQPDRASASTYQFSKENRYSVAQINHYPLGSIENFLIKQERGKPNHDTDAIDLGYWLDRNFAEAEDLSILRHAAEVAKRRDAFLRDPELAALHQNAVEWRKKRIRYLLAQPEHFGTYTTLLHTPPTRPLPLPEQEALLNQLVRLRRRIRNNMSKSGKSAND